jgi:hypothetical protein
MIVCDCIASVDGMTDERWITEDLEGSDRDLVEVLSQ